MEQQNIVKVRYFSEKQGEPSQREYTYFSNDRLNVGDIITVPVRDTTSKAIVSSVDVPESEIEPYRNAVKTIPSGATVTKEPITLDVEDDISPPEDDQTSLTIIKPSDDQVAQAFYDQGLKLLGYATTLVIKSVDDIRAATNDLSIIGQLRKAVEERRKDYLAPFREHIDEVNQAYKTIMAPVEEANTLTREKILTFEKDQERIRREQEEINRKRMEAAEAEMRLKGELSESVDLVEVVEAPKTVRSELGTTGQRANWKWEVTDFSLLPDEYKVPDSAMLNSIARKHHDQKPIPGVRFYSEPILGVRTK